MLIHSFFSSIMLKIGKKCIIFFSLNVIGIKIIFSPLGLRIFHQKVWEFLKLAIYRMRINFFANRTWSNGTKPCRTEHYRTGPVRNKGNAYTVLIKATNFPRTYFFQNSSNFGSRRSIHSANETRKQQIRTSNRYILSPFFIMRWGFLNLLVANGPVPERTDKKKEVIKLIKSKKVKKKSMIGIHLAFLFRYFIKQPYFFLFCIYLFVYILYILFFVILLKMI